ncbi:MAG: hypothetical protein ABL986_19005 [Vicinamibacterales bacterium]
MITIDLKWLFTTLIALWGAGLSTWQFFERRKDKLARIRVFFNPISMLSIQPGNPTVPILFIKAKNIGLVDVHFKPTNAEVEVAGMDTHFLLSYPDSDVTFPATLKAGDAFTTFTPRKALADAIAVPFQQLNLRTKHLRLRANVWDAVGNIYSSDWVDTDLDTISK